jgi:hypothetical protein
MINILSQYIDAIAIPLAIEKDVVENPSAGIDRDDDDTNCIVTRTIPTKTSRVVQVGCLLVGYGNYRKKKLEQNNNRSRNYLPTQSDLSTNNTSQSFAKSSITTPLESSSQQLTLLERRVQNPIFISVGHKMSLSDAIKLCTLLSLSRIPEPIKQADFLGRELLRQKEKERKKNNRNVT